MIKREPLSNADYALVRFDSPENWMIITALVTFETRLELEGLTAVVQRFMLQQRRFHQRLVQPRVPNGRAYWEEVENFNISQHLTPIHTPLPGEPKLLEVLVSRLMSVGLDFSRPLWQFYLVERYGDASALVMRFHHSLADGVSLVNVLSAMTQDRPGDAANAYSAPIPATTGAQQVHRNSEKAGSSPLRDLVGTSLQLLRNSAERKDAIRWGGSLFSAIATIVFSTPDSDNLFRGPVGEAKRATWSPAIPLERIKWIGDSFDGTINDVLLSAVVGALRRYMPQAADGSYPQDLHGLVPVDMRRDTRLAPLGPFTAEKIKQSLGNQVGAALLDLPVEIEDPILRLAVIHQSMDLLKASGEAHATNLLMNLLGILPGGVHDLAVRFWGTKNSAIMTNVTGPRTQLYLGNSAIDTIIGWVPNFGSAGLGVSFFSYNGNVRLGIAVDQGLVPDPEQIVNYFLDELRQMDARTSHGRYSPM